MHGQVAQLGRLLADGGELGPIVEDLDRADDRAAPVANRGCVHPHRDAMAVAMAQEHLGLTRLTVAHRGGERAARATQLPAVRVHVVEDVVVAKVPDDRFGVVPGQALGTAVPVLDPAAAVDVVDAIGHLVEHGTLEAGFGTGERLVGAVAVLG